MSATLAPKFVVIDDFLPDDVLASLDDHARRDPRALTLMELGGAPEQGHYSALRKLWVHKDGLGSFDPPFRSAVLARFAELCAGTGVPPFDVARVETELCAQRPGSYFAKHIDTDTREPSRSLSSDRLISSVFYFPRQPLAFSGGELILYDFTGKIPAARIAPRRNRLVAFPSFLCHEVTPVTDADDSLDGARWSVNCWLHRARPVPAEAHESPNDL
jgi:Rps23 Pro-64 3,4-dihydroxylase Tpa1-like proline 4-hydroxylase